ncbi:MAG: LysM peptidoglycan-binding domain-containing protein [Bacteroidales bacterium]|nr:LysM peptidoglycan-binding domain-containing protein [Bacteroidales bacterium]
MGINSIIRYITLLLIVLPVVTFTTTSGQVPVSRSTEKVVVRGTSYYIHTVGKGQTSFSIARAYGVTVEILHKENPEALYGLKEGQVLKIPVVDISEKPRPEKDNERFVYHIMAPGETIFALSRRYDVPQSAIIEANPDIDPADIPIGSEIAIPRKEFKAPTVSISPQKEEYTLYKVKQGETMSSISRAFGVPARELRRANGGLIFVRAGETIRIPGRHTIVGDTGVDVSATDTLLIIAEADTLSPEPLAVEFTDITTLRGSIDIAVMLPLFLAENRVRQEIDTTVANSRRVRERPFHWIFPSTYSFLEMYEGILLAADKMRDAGLEVRLHTFDTRADSFVVDGIINSGRLRDMDFIIGPIYSYNLLRVSKYAGDYNIPVVSPVPLMNNSVLHDNPSLYVVNSSLQTAQETLARAIAEHFESNIVFIYSDTATVNNESMAFRNMIMRELSYRTDVDRVNFKQVLYKSRSNSPTDTLNRLSHALNPAMKNIIILGTEDESAVSETVMSIHSLIRRHQIVVYAYPSIRNLESNIDLTYFFDLGLSIYSPFRVDYNNQKTLDFLSDFRNTFGYEPVETSFAWLGYDITQYFSSGLAMHGRRFINNPQMHNPELLNARFDFRREGSGDGFENWGLFRLMYTEDMELVVVEDPVGSNGIRYLPYHSN